MKVMKDWRWVRGTVFVPTNAINEAQEWDEYDPNVNDRELHCASVYGITCVRVFLYDLIYEKKKDAFLKEIEDFLTRADKYHIKVEFVFFDSCWNNPPPDILDPKYVYPPPIYGTHNSRWLKEPSDDYLAKYLENKDPSYKTKLKDYVESVVNAHKNDPRIAFWETYNEPDSSKEPAQLQLMADSLKWIHDTGSTIPVTATGTDHPGDPYSDFLTWHKYGGDYDIPQIPIYSLCTECMERQDMTVPNIVSHFRDKVGFIMWEFGIGRDNCRFNWDQTGAKHATQENSTPFHGIVFPDGHPWSVDDVRALVGEEAFNKEPLFKVRYYLDPTFTTLAKESVTPMIDFDLNDEKGTNVPDSTIRMPESNWSVRWTGLIAAPQSGDYTFTVDGDNAVKVIVDGRTVINKTDLGRGTTNGNVILPGDHPVPIEIDYVHTTGLSSLHLDWSGPGVSKQAVTPVAQ
ncbi:MAG TPA: PA14 domain-containing protein [Candidatus Methylacidiphilales bacterium]|nr:PA14 domain-containing protein [Candidatus Methylacidiphilales bacterium]